MAEFKVSEGLTGEISAFQTAGSGLNAAYTAVSADGVDTLSTAKAYIKKLTEIKELIDLYKELAVKDAADLAAMYESVQATDAKLAGGFSK